MALGGSLWFDLGLYRRLDCVSRRLFVLLQRIFHRASVSPTFDVRRLCVHSLGFSPTLDMWNLKVKLSRCIERLAVEGVVHLPEGAKRAQDLFVKRGVGSYSIALRRGAHFEGRRGLGTPLSPDDSPLGKWNLLNSVPWTCAKENS